MSLFRNKKYDSFLNQTFTELKNSELLDYLITDMKDYFTSNEYSWLSLSTDYYDEGERSVVITGDGVLIFNCSIENVAAVNDAQRRVNWASHFALMSQKSFNRLQDRHEELTSAAKNLFDKEVVPLIYTSYAFTPIPSGRTSPDNEIYLDRDDLLAAMANAVKSRMQEIFPSLQCSKSNIALSPNTIDTNMSVAFSYKVPKLKWKTWF